LMFAQKEKLLKRNALFVSSGLDSIHVTTGEDYVKPLVRFFKLRERRW